MIPAISSQIVGSQRTHSTQEEVGKGVVFSTDSPSSFMLAANPPWEEEEDVKKQATTNTSHFRKQGWGIEPYAR